MTNGGSTSELLSAKGVTLRFGGLTALSEVDFTVSDGQIFGLIGPNGAGKTTLMNVISGVYRPDEGQVIFDGDRINGMRPHKIAQRGIARTFQVMRPFVGLTVRENVAIGARFGRAGASMSMQAAMNKADEVLDWMELGRLASSTVSKLTTAERKKLELARALAMKPKLLLLDEVMAGLNPREVGEAMTLIRRVREQGVTVMLIEHVMKAVMGLCDTILVLHHGAPIASGAPEAVASDEAVIKAYLGERYTARRKEETRGR